MTANLSPEQKADEGAGRDPSGQALAAAPSSPSVSPLTGFDPSRLDWAAFPYLRKTGRYAFFAVCGFCVGTVGSVFLRSAGFNREWAYTAIFPVMFVVFMALRDMSAQWDWVLRAHAQAMSAGTAETEGLRAKPASAVPSGMRPTPAAPGVHP